LRIVHVTTLFSPCVGGIEIASQKIAEEQAKLGHEVYIITSDACIERSPRIERNFITIIRVRSWNVLYPNIVNFITPKEIPINILKNSDVVIGWGHIFYFVYKILDKVKKIGTPIALYFIGVDYLRHHYNPIFRLLGYQYQKFLTKKFVKIVDMAFTTNEIERKLLRERYGLDSYVLPHGVDEIYFKLPNMANHFRKKYGIDGMIVGYISRIHPTKGLDILIKAFAKVSNLDRDLILVIAGKGDVNYLRKCLNIAKKLGIANKVRYVGYLSEEDKIGLIDASEIIVLPSRHAGESYPLLIDEVKARGKPLVVTNYGTLPFRVKNMVEGVVVRADPESLAEGIKYVLENTKKFRVVEVPRTWNNIAKEFTALLKEISLH